MTMASTFHDRAPRLPLLLLLAAACLTITSAQQKDFQPRTIVTVEQFPARRQLGSLSLPHGSPWCEGKPTYWLVGHQGDHESPWCLQVSNDTALDSSSSYYNYSGSTWERSKVAVLDEKDELNDDGKRYIDRHDCAVMDVNQDNVPDVLCGVGADSGKGLGYNEVYLTQTAKNQTSVPPGSLVKALQGHGLQLFPSMRNRWMQTVVAADGASLVLLATRGQPRTDGQPNEHRMFRLEAPAPNTTHGFYFHHVPGPWMRLTKVECLQIVDVNQDGLDDILMCNMDSRAFLFLQNPDSSWTEVEFWDERGKDWRGARIADVNGDGVNDLIVVGAGGQKPKKRPESYVRVFAGVPEPPYFHLSSTPLWEMVTPFATPDVQVLDVNSDGIADIYVVQTDESTSGNYCASNYAKTWTGPIPPVSFVPDLDRAADILLVGLGNGNFTQVSMTHAEPGCGAKVELFGNNRTMILAQGTMGKVGHNLLLQW